MNVTTPGGGGTLEVRFDPLVTFPGQKDKQIWSRSRGLAGHRQHTNKGVKNGEFCLLACVHDMINTLPKSLVKNSVPQSDFASKFNDPSTLCDKEMIN